MAHTITIQTDGNSDFPDSFSAYIAEPPAEFSGAPRGAVIVIHEIWGLVEHITDIADRYAAEGYLVLAPDILSAIGIEAQVGAELFAIRNSPDERVRTEGQPRLREAFSSLSAPGYAAWAVDALTKAVDYLERQPGVEGRIAVTGFCFGGTYSFALAAADPRVKAAIPFYGTAPAPEDIAKITAPIRAFYGVHDPALIDKLPEVRRQMTDAGVDFQATVYDDAGHAFFNDTNPSTYRAADAADAWAKSNAFLAETLDHP
ncbi:dienelactone hydrolase family protein [Lacisediminihabitans changchengi]|uniref:Dienelactone hydrolase family protein n=1 Tax=Lacisediminihabitans changchengi TaxID=2787634 RepID=A0A934SR89_9MICO|nr:dienelactone hydrolase family protein [Lacisediminihabitans changchengi]MBK4347573.1 dienelactone hydrolase family protein [Lacisediminihabitans changchengi]